MKQSIIQFNQLRTDRSTDQTINQPSNETKGKLTGGKKPRESNQTDVQANGRTERQAHSTQAASHCDRHTDYTTNTYMADCQYCT